MSATVTAKYLRMLAPLVDSGTRENLKGVHIEPHPLIGALLIATDGHRLGVIHDASGKVETTATWRVDHHVVKWLRRHEASAEMARFIDGRIEIMDLVGDIKFIAQAERAPGGFPDWRKVIRLTLARPAGAGVGARAYNPALLGDFRAMGKYVLFRPTDGRGATIVNAEDMTEFYGLVMPTPWTEAIPDTPDWLDLNEAKESAA